MRKNKTFKVHLSFPSYTANEIGGSNRLYFSCPYDNQLSISFFVHIFEQMLKIKKN